jgi:hypothetical protein
VCDKLCVRNINQVGKCFSFHFSPSPKSERVSEGVDEISHKVRMSVHKFRSFLTRLTAGLITYAHTQICPTSKHTHKKKKCFDDTRKRRVTNGF